MNLKITFKDGEKCVYLDCAVVEYTDGFTIFDRQGRVLRSINSYEIESMMYSNDSIDSESKNVYSADIHTLDGRHIVEPECYIKLFDDYIYIQDFFGDIIDEVPMEDINHLICHVVKK